MPDPYEAIVGKDGRYYDRGEDGTWWVWESSRGEWQALGLAVPAAVPRSAAALSGALPYTGQDTTSRENLPYTSADRANLAPLGKPHLGGTEGAARPAALSGENPFGRPPEGTAPEGTAPAATGGVDVAPRAQTAGGAIEPEIMDVVDYWEDPQKKDKDNNPLTYMQDPGELPGGLFGSGNYRAKKITRVTYTNGQVYDIDESGKRRLIEINRGVAAQYKAQNPLSGPTPRTDPFGNKVTWDPATGTFVPAPGMPTKTEDSWLTPNTSARYLLRRTPEGSIEQTENPNYKEPVDTPRSPYSGDFTQGGTRYRYNAQGLPEPIFSFPEAEDKPTAYQQWSMNRQESDDTYQQEQDRIKREQYEDQQAFARKQAAWRAASDIIEQRRQMAPMALIPGQTHFLGYEPGGAWQKVAGQLGLPFDPDRFRVAPQTIDWEAEWRQAQQRFGR